MIDHTLLNSFGEYKIASKKNSESVYHYTSISSLKGIIENKKLWVTRSDFLNDPAEVIYLGDLVRGTIEALRTTQSISYNFLDALFASYGSHFVTAYPRNYYILSLSKNRDSLAMWNYYGKNDGYCIGINFDNLSESLKFNRYSFIHGEIVYNSDIQIEILAKELETAYAYWLNVYNGESNMLHTIIDTLFSRWSFYTLFFKHSAYQNEEEYRIAFTHRGDFDVKFRTAHGVFTPYIEVPTTKDSVNDSFPLESVTIGPLIKHDNASLGLSEWLSKHKHSLSEPTQGIFPSNIPLRF